MPRPARFVPMPGDGPTVFDHGAHDPLIDRVFVARTGRNGAETLDHTHRRTLAGLPEAECAARDGDAGAGSRRRRRGGRAWAAPDHGDRP